MTAMVVAIACSSKEEPLHYKRFCGLEQQEAAAAFVIECARAGNPMSDEEGEDLVRECGNQATRLFCPLVPGRRHDYVFIPCTEDLSPRPACSALPWEKRK